MNTPKAPAPPDPVATAAAQTASNKETAVTQQQLNQTDQVGPDGSLSYSQMDNWADGTPHYQATTTLSPDQQALYDLSNQTQQNLGQIGVDQSSRIGALLGTPLNLDSATEDKIDQLGRTRLDPLWQQNQSALDSQLINKGIAPGTEAWNQAQTQLGQQRNDAYNSLYLNGRSQAMQEALTQRNQPINEISALLSGSQVSQPNFSNTPSAGVAPTDVIGATNAAYQGQLSAYNTQSQQANAFNSGLFSLAGVAAKPAAAWAFSDISTKENIDVVGERPDGLHVIDFDYKPGIGDDTRHRGLIAQEVAQVYPHAVAKTRTGMMAVNYADIPRNGGLMGLGLRRAA